MSVKKFNYGELISHESNAVMINFSTSPVDSIESNRPTPETDLETIYCDAIPAMPWVDSDFARKLERERDEAREKWKEQHEALRMLADHGESEIQRLTKERDEAREQIPITALEAAK